MIVRTCPSLGWTRARPPGRRRRGLPPSASAASSSTPIIGIRRPVATWRQYLLRSASSLMLDKRLKRLDDRGVGRGFVAGALHPIPPRRHPAAPPDHVLIGLIGIRGA